MYAAKSKKDVYAKAFMLKRSKRPGKYPCGFDLKSSELDGIIALEPNDRVGVGEVGWQGGR